MEIPVVVPPPLLKPIETVGLTFHQGRIPGCQHGLVNIFIYSTTLMIIQGPENEGDEV